MSKYDAHKKSLLDWLDEFYEDTGTLSTLIRNLAFAGIGLIWIFKNTDLNSDILPKPLVSPLKFIVLGLIFDVGQYLWRSITIYIEYKIRDIKFSKKQISEADISDVTMPNYIATGSWVFFSLKIIFVAIAYVLIYKFIIHRL